MYLKNRKLKMNLKILKFKKGVKTINITSDHKIKECSLNKTFDVKMT